MNQQLTSIIALDVGTVRTGVAIANSIARIAGPLTTLTDQDTLPQQVAELVKEHDAQALIIGLPRSLNGDSTNQTAYVEKVAHEIAQEVSVPISFVDEALTSTKAEAELATRKKPFDKADVDMLSATYILEDFMNQNPEVFGSVQ